MIRGVVWLTATAVGLYLLHRLALWAESRGYVYYLNKVPSRSSIGTAFLEVQSLIEPDKRALVEVIREEPSEQDEMGEPPEPGNLDPGEPSSPNSVDV